MNDVMGGGRCIGDLGWMGSPVVFRDWMVANGLECQLAPLVAMFQLPGGDVMIPVKIRARLSGRWCSMAERLVQKGGRVVAVAEEAFAV